MREALEAMLDFALVTASRVLSGAQSVVLTLRGDVHTDAAATSELVPDCEVWGEPALLWRPAAADSSGQCEVMVVRRGDTLEVIGARERRWQISIEEGEVVLRAFGASAAKIRLKPNGDVELGLGATEKAILGDAFKTYFDNHIHSGVAVGAGATGIPTVPMPAGTLSTKVKVGA